MIFRNMLTDLPSTEDFYWEQSVEDAIEEDKADRDLIEVLWGALRFIWDHLEEAYWYRETITEWALSMSLCPVHFVDYAACFDDDDPECAQVRMVHPSHDT
jgi:hypothetical protein